MPTSTLSLRRRPFQFPLTFHGASRRTLPSGLIFAIAADHGVEMKGKGHKRTCRCPFHEDKHASAFLSVENVFYCSVCTPEGGWSAKTFCIELGGDWSRYVAFPTATFERRALAPRFDAPATPMFTAAEAQAIWELARARARDDSKAQEDSEAYHYLAERSLLEAAELGSFGVLGPGMQLPPAVRRWPELGYRVVVALHDLDGTITNLQARAIVKREKKVLFPTGSVAKGTLFACARGLELLRGTFSGRRAVLYAEGLTDFLALSISSPVPVLAAPGSGVAADGVGPWVEGCDLVLALDWDEAGEGAVEPTASAAYRFGARSVQRLEWPDSANDACDVVTRLGTAGLEAFLVRLLGRDLS